MQLFKVAENPCTANSYCSLEAEMCTLRKLADFLDTYTDTDMDVDMDMDINSGREIPGKTRPIETRPIETRPMTTCPMTTRP